MLRVKNIILKLQNKILNINGIIDGFITVRNVRAIFEVLCTKKQLKKNKKIIKMEGLQIIHKFLTMDYGKKIINLVVF